MGLLGQLKDLVHTINHDKGKEFAAYGFSPRFLIPTFTSPIFIFPGSEEPMKTPIVELESDSPSLKRMLIQHNRKGGRLYHTLSQLLAL